MVEFSTTQDKILELPILGGHENDALPYPRVVHLIVGRGVGGQLDEVILDPLSPFHLVSLFEVHNAVLPTELSGKIGCPSVEASPVHHHLVSPHLV